MLFERPYVSTATQLDPRLLFSYSRTTVRRANESGCVRRQLLWAMRSGTTLVGQGRRHGHHGRPRLAHAKSRAVPTDAVHERDKGEMPR